MKKLSALFLHFIFMIDCLSINVASHEHLNTVYQWSQMDFNFPTEARRQQALADGSFVPVNASAPASMEVAGSRVFITLPRWKNGVPATLNTVPFPADTPSPRLTPYPSLEFNRQGNCNGLTSVYRVKVDQCKRLWALDTGTVNAFANAENICPSQVIAFDLNNDEVIQRFVFPNHVIQWNSQLVTIEVEYPGGNCGSPSDAVLYVADTVGFALIVVDLSTGKSWRVRDKTMYASPEAGTFNVAGETFELMDGILGLSLSTPSIDRERLLFYYSMSSFNQRWVPTRILRDESLANTSPQAFESAENLRSSQGGDCAMDQQGVMFFGLLGEQAVACWNTFSPYNPIVIEQNDETMQFPVSVQVDNEEKLWVFATKFQSFFLGTLPAEGINFRILMANSTADLVKGTPCEANLNHQKTSTYGIKQRNNNIYTSKLY